MKKNAKFIPRLVLLAAVVLLYFGARGLKFSVLNVVDVHRLVAPRMGRVD